MIDATKAKNLTEKKELDKIKENAKHFCEIIISQRIEEFSEDGYNCTFYISKTPIFQQDFYKCVKEYLENKGYHVSSCDKEMIEISW